VNTNTQEFEKWISLLPFPPWLIPLQKSSKVPDIPAGESWKDEKWRLTIDQARERLKNGLNVGVVAVNDYVFWDHDNPEKFNFPVETLTVMTRNGRLHKYYVNSGDVKNADGKGKYKGCGEIRAEWKYVVAPGSYVPLDKDAKPEATGLYKIVNVAPPALLSSKDLPPEFLPGFAEQEKAEVAGSNPTPPTMAGSFRNQYGWSIEDIRRRDKKLDELLSSLQPADYPSPSEADMAALSKLLFWGYSEGEAVDILKYFRGRDKLSREDYLKMTLSKVARGETIANYVDPSRWKPASGYGLPFEAESPDFDVTHKVSLIFKVLSKQEIGVKAVKEGKDVTAWVTIDKPEKLRTSHNAKILREVLEKDNPADWKMILEKTIERIQVATASFEPEKHEEKKEPEVSPTVEAEVKRILTSDNPLAIIKQHLDNVIAGEDANKLTIFILLLSGKCPDPSLKQMILLKAEAGAGKTTLMSIADFFKTKRVGRFTEHALDYSELEGYEVLLLQEVGSMDEEKQGVSTLKFLSSEDEGYIVEFTIKDPETGEFTTKQRRVPPITVISSTTRVSLDPQYTRRNWIICPDESKQQTMRIAEWIEKHEQEKAEVILGVKKETGYDWSKKVLKELVKQIKPASIIIPFTRTLLGILESTSLRVRGDYKRILALVKFYCILMQNHLPKIPAANSNTIVATPEAALNAVNVALEPLTLMTAELDERTKKTLEVMDALGLTEPGTVIDKDVRGKIEVQGGWSSNTARQYLNELESRGFLSGDDKRPKSWCLLHDMETIRRKLSALSAKIENADVLINEMVKEGQEWLKHVSATEKGGYAEMFSRREIIPTHPPFLIADKQLGKEQAQSEKVRIEQTHFEKLRMILSVLVEMERENGIVEKTALLSELESKHQIPRAETERMIGQLLREGTIYEPREGYLKKT